MRRGITATALVAALALAATACGSDDKSDGSSKSSGELSGTVTWWDTSTVGSEDKVFKKIAEDFEKQHPKVDVKYVNVPFGEAQNKFKNAAQSGSGAPDVIRSEVAWTPEFADLGYLAPLDGTPALQKADDFLKQAAASTKYNGKTYAVPQVIDSMGIFYNKKIFKEACCRGSHHRRPAEDRLQEDQGKDRQDRPVPARRRRVLVPVLPVRRGRRPRRRVHQVRHRRQPRGRQGDEGRQGPRRLRCGQDRRDGRLGEHAVVLQGRQGRHDHQRPVGRRRHLQPARSSRTRPTWASPRSRPSSAAQGAPQGGHNLAVYAGSKNLDASYAFVDYMTSTKTQAQVTKELNLLPTRTSAYSEEAVVDNEIVGFFKPVVETAVERPWIPETGSLFAPLVTEYTKVLTGQTTPEKAAKATGDSYRKLLKGWK